MADNFFYSESSGWHVIDENFVSLLPADCVEKTEAEHQAYVESLAVKSDETKLSEFKVTVQAALDASDLVALRAYKAGINFGEEWGAYDQKLRALMAVTEWHGDLALPPQPISYPS